MKTVTPFLRGLIPGCMIAIGLAAGASVALGAIATSAPAPELSIALRGLLDDTLEQGEPLRVAVRIECSRESTGGVELAPATGTWADAIAVELLAANGGGVLARATAMGAPSSPRATLDREHVAGGMWLFPASAMGKLRQGDYVVRSRIVVKDGVGWRGEVSSEEAPFKVVAVSEAPERVSARTLARAQIACARGSFEEAARGLDAVLAKTPDDFELLCLRADVALSGGNPIGAMICVNRAARVLAPQASGPPPTILHDVQSRVLAARLAPDVTPASVPEWTWPPLAVIHSSEKEAGAPGSPTVPPAIAPSSSTTTPAPASTKKALNAPTPNSSVVSPEKTASAGTMASTTSPRVAVGPSIGEIVAAAELGEEKIRADPAGQWAASATAGTQYGRTQYSAAQATGAPNVPVAGNSPDAWCPANKDKGVDWLEVTFAKPIRAREVRVRQNDAAGAITKIEAISPYGTPHVWWQGVDPYKASAVREIVWFAVRVPETSYLVTRVKLTLNLASGPGYKEIDAVQLVGAAP